MKNVVLLIMLLIFTSCNYTGIKSTLTQMSGKVVILDSLTPIFLGKEMSGKIKIEPKYARLVVYYDSTYCQSCRINRLDEWNGIISLEKKYDYNFDVMFIFSPVSDQHNSLRRSFATNRFNHIVWFDKDGFLMKLNQFIPNDNRFHIFLLDKNNKIVLVGDPLSNHGIMSLFEAMIDNMIEHKGEYIGS